MAESMTAAEPSVPARAEGAPRACSAATRQAPGGLAGCAGAHAAGRRARSEMKGKTELLRCRHRRRLRGRCSCVRAARGSGPDWPAEPAPLWGAATCTPGPPSRSSPGWAGCPAAHPRPRPPPRLSLEVWGQVWTPSRCDRSTLPQGATVSLNDLLPSPTARRSPVAKASRLNRKCPRQSLPARPKPGPVSEGRTP
nr:uncharacterized protein LOC123574425 [Macaca fascicularis]